MIDLNNLKNLTTTASQSASLLNSATSQITSGLGSLSPTSALSGVGDSILKAGSSITGAFTGAKDALSKVSTGVVSKFKDNFKPPSPTAIKRPSVSSRTDTQTGVLTFPADLGNAPSISFNFVVYSRPTPTEEKKFNPIVTVTLPMPGELMDRFSAQYSGKDLGALGRVLEESNLSILEGAAAFKDLNAGKSDAERLTNTVKQPGVAYGLARSTLNDTAVGALVDRITGTALNPHTALQFQGMNLRKHSFKFKLSPNNPKEALELQNIIRAFKENMLPNSRGLLFDFPNQCIITFNNPNTPYSFKKCFLESMNINYAPSGVPSFFKGGGFTSEVEISLDFGEMSPVTKEDVVDGGGDISEYADKIR